MGAGALHYRLTVTDTSARVLRTLSFRGPLIEGPGQGEIVILTDHRAEPSRRRQLELLGALGPDGIVRELSALEASEAKGTPFSGMFREADIRTYDPERDANIDVRVN
jgi:hypothetical protein